MNKVSIILAILLVGALIAVPVAYQSGKGSLTAGFQASLDAIETENTKNLAQFESTLSQSQMNWEMKYLTFQAHVRETLLNTGVELEVLNASPPPEEAVIDTVDTLITQDTFTQLKTGMNYDDVIDLLGREGENTLNMMDENGTGTSSYVWKWKNEDELEDRLTITFIDLKLTNKHYTAFKL